MSANDLQCNVCMKWFSTQRIRDRHRAKFHRNALPHYKCPLNGCNASFSWLSELNKHNRMIHCNNYKCNDCGLDYKNKTYWDVHYLIRHALYEEKLTHSLPPQPEGENYLPKIYLAEHTDEPYFKVGETGNPMKKRLTDLKADEGETLLYVKSWILSAKFTPIRTKMLEKIIHVRMPTLGFKQRKEEYFFFNNKEADKILIIAAITAIIEEYEQMEFVAHVPSRPMKDVKRGEKRKWTPPCENPTEKQLQEREQKKKYRAKHKGQYLYYCSNGVDVGKIGETIKHPPDRISAHNSGASSNGKFDLKKQWLLPEEYKDTNKRRALEFRVRDKMQTRFALVDGKIDHFNILPSEDAEAIAIIDEIINSL